MRLAHREQESEGTWENRRRGRDVVGEREGEKEPGGSAMKFEGRHLIEFIPCVSNK